MPAYKTDNNTWMISFYYQNWEGGRSRKVKRGFQTKKEAIAWEENFKHEQTCNLSMSFESFLKIYENDLMIRLKENTWQTKKHIIYQKILPFFKSKAMNQISSADIIRWQNEMMQLRTSKGEKYAQTYLKTLHNQCSAIFNHAERYYDLRTNPARKAGSMGSKQAQEYHIWTKEEYQCFADAMMDKPLSFYAFELLYWCGIREGELLALTVGDFDFEHKMLSINKSYQRMKGRDVITDPKTTKSKRTISMPRFLVDEIQEFINSIYGVKKNDRLFEVTKSYLYNEMKRGCKEKGVKRIKIHELRHSHVSLLVDMNFSLSAIADRLGHESTQITSIYAHLFPSKQIEMADKLDLERRAYEESTGSTRTMAK